MDNGTSSESRATSYEDVIKAGLFDDTVQRITFNPDDAVVVTVPRALSSGQADTLTTHVRRVFGEDAKVLILTDGVNLAVVGKG